MPIVIDSQTKKPIIKKQFYQQQENNTSINNNKIFINIMRERYKIEF